jgi:hypothetical protein
VLTKQRLLKVDLRQGRRFRGQTKAVSTIKIAKAGGLARERMEDVASSSNKSRCENMVRLLLVQDVILCLSTFGAVGLERLSDIHFPLLIIRIGMILGDHPGCRFGLPVTLEWDYVEYDSLCVNEYEIHHALRRPLRKMYLPAERRKNMMQALGYKTLDFNKATREVNRLRNQRFRTKEMPLFLVILDAGLESLVRKVKRFAGKWR